MFDGPFMRAVAATIALAVLGACAGRQEEAAPPPLGDFRLGYNIAIADEATLGPFSREATEAELEVAVEEAVEARLGAYDGDGLYHLGLYLGGYVLAQPGVPLIYTPKSVLVIDVSLFDNADGRLNEEAHRVIAFEGLQNTRPIVGSGLTRSKDEQLQNLAAEAARQIQAWLQENEGWFAPDPNRPRVAFDPALRDAPAPDLPQPGA